MKTAFVFVTMIRRDTFLDSRLSADDERQSGSLLAPAVQVFDQAGCQGTVTMVSRELGPFDLAITAFEIRFAEELTSCWDSVVSATIQPLVAAAPEDKQGVLRKCFSDAADKIAAVVHTRFPLLLRVALQHRPCPQQATPRSWTAAQIRKQTCKFLGMDEDKNFKDIPTPSEDSRVIEATRRILYCALCLPANSTNEFLLPWWANRRHLQVYFIGRQLVEGGYPFSSKSGDDGETMSPTDTLTWIRECEVEIRDKLERQIEKEMFDAVIAAGGAGDAVTMEPTGTTQNMMTLMGDTWEVHYSGKEGDAHGTVKDMDGMRYYALLISETVKGRSAISAEELMWLKGLYFPGSSYRSDTSDDGATVEENKGFYSDSYQKTYEPSSSLTSRKGLDQACTITYKGSTTDDGTVDKDTVDGCRKRIEEIYLALQSLRVRPNQTNDDFIEMEKLEAENDQLVDYLTRNYVPQGRTGGPTKWAQFSNSGEKARKAVDMGMKRARNRMERQPCLRPLLDHLVTSVKMGRSLSYNGSNWQIQGLPVPRKARS